MENIFNLIKYPVTIRFEREILEALPPLVLDYWWEEFIQKYSGGNPKYSRIPPTADRLHQYLNHSTSMKARGWALKLLRARILALEE